MERRDRMIQSYKNDPYFLREKYSEPAVCRECGVVFQDGIFEWVKNPPADAEEITCPACMRIRDDYEGGLVVLEGDFLQGHRGEITNLIENTADHEARRRPLERILDMETSRDGRITVRTTYEHLARRIAEAVHSAYKGDLALNYPGEEKYVRAHWHRD
jgi:hypothetical protein